MVKSLSDTSSRSTANPWSIGTQSTAGTAIDYNFNNNSTSNSYFASSLK